MTRTLASPVAAAPLGARLFLSVLGRMRHGHLELITPDGARMVFGHAHDPAGAVLRLLDWRACQAMLRAGDIGFADAYAAGWVDTPDLAALLRLAIRNENALAQVFHGGLLARLWYRLRHGLRANTRHGSQRNIHAHYDLGNDFYALWLDSTWTYSSALFEGDARLSLEQAQERKYQRILDVLALQPGARVLEIGCGWGGFAEYAGRRGLQVHGVTISPAQLSVAQQRIAQAGLGERVQLELRDYRDLEGAYDAVVSIEMFEAVGERYWPEYFATVAARLRAGGQALVQSITIGEPWFARYRASADFIQTYIFPGGMLPSVERFEAAAGRAGLAPVQRHAFGRDYATTLRHWDQRFQAAREQVGALGFDARFQRIWQMYFAYCEAAFDEGRTDVVQFLLRKA